MSSKDERGLFLPEIAPKGGVMPRRADTLKCEDVLLVKQSMHSYNTSAALVLRMEGGARAIEKACELIDDQAHFTCVLNEEQLHKLLKMLLGMISDQTLDKLDRIVVPVSEWR